MKYDTVIFDYDGTLMDTASGIATSMSGALAAHGITESASVIEGLIGPPLTKVIAERYSLSPEQTAAIMKDHWANQLASCKNGSKLYDGVPEMLRALRAAGLKLAIATNKPLELAIPQLEYHGLRELFTDIEGADFSQSKGTKSDFVRIAAENCGSDSRRAVMVGDRKGDIKGGKDNGMDTIGVLYGYGSREELIGCGSDMIAASPAEVARIVTESAG